MRQFGLTMLASAKVCAGYLCQMPFAENDARTPPSAKAGVRERMEITSV